MIRCSGKLEGVASFPVESTDFTVTVALEDVRVAYWDDWQRRGQGGYGNPCMNLAGGPFLSTKLRLPGNPAMPCDSLEVPVLGVGTAQHVALGDKSLRVEITQPDSVRVDTTPLVGIDKGSFKLQEIDGQWNLSFKVANGRSVSWDRLGNSTDDWINHMQLVCPTRGDAEVVSRVLALSR